MEPEGGELPHPQGKLGVLRGQEAAFTEAEDLGGVQADDAGQSGVVQGVETGGGVDQHRNAGPVAERQPGVHVRHPSERADRDHGGDLAAEVERQVLDLGRIQHPGVGVHVDEPGGQPCLHDRVGGGDEGPGGQHHIAAGREIHRLQRERDRLGRVGGGDDLGRALEALGQSLLEFAEQRPEVGVPARLVDPLEVGKDRFGRRQAGTCDGHLAGRQGRGLQ